MSSYSLSLWVLFIWAFSVPINVDAKPSEIQYVLPRLLEERSSEGRLTLLVNENIALNLEKTSAFAETFDVIRCQEDVNLFQEMTTADFTGDVYKDNDNHAAVLVSREDGLRIKGIIGGTLKIDHHENLVPNKDGLVLHFLKEIKHNIVGQDDTKILEDDFDILSSPGEHFSVENNILSARNAETQKAKSGPKIVTAETMVVVSSYYEAAFRSTDYSEVKDLFDYLRVLFAFVNLVLSQAKKDVLDLKLSVTGIVLLDSRTETFLKKIHNADAMEKTTLDKFETFVEQKSSVFGKADIVLYLSKFRIGKFINGKLDLSTAGFASLGGACTTHRGGLVSDTPKEFEGVLTIAHESLHLLGCAHDGDRAPEYLKNSPGATKCSAHGDFVMASFHEGPKKRRLSACTQYQVLAYIKSPRGHCLLSAVVRQTESVRANIMDQMFVDRERFCKRVLPDKQNVKFLSHYDQKHDIKNCMLLCSWPAPNGLNVRSQVAPNYTPCYEAKGKVTKVCLYSNCTKVPIGLRSFGGRPKVNL